MRTPMQELLDYTTDLLHTFDSEQRVAMAVLDYLKTNKRALLNKEKEVMIDFAYKFGDEPLVEIAKWYDKQFNTKEK